MKVIYRPVAALATLIVAACFLPAALPIMQSSGSAAVGHDSSRSVEQINNNRAAPSGVLFPTTGVLDSFDRQNGSLGTGWSGSTGGYTITGNQLNVGAGGDIYWNPTAFGADQEAYVTLATIDENAEELDLLLKAQSNTNWAAGVLEIWYSPVYRRVQVWTYDSGQGWLQHGEDISATLLDGDQLGARAGAGGVVEVYHNGVLLASRDVTSWPHFAKSGYIGLWTIGADNAMLDSFGGGTAAAAAPTTTPTAAAATSTGSPTPPGASPTPAADRIFGDGFESSNLAAWSDAQSDGGDLSVSSSAALVGGYGLFAFVDDTLPIFVEDRTPAGESRYRARFYFDPNGMLMLLGTAHTIFQGYDGNSTAVVRLEFGGGITTFQLRGWIRGSQNSWYATRWQSISDAAHIVELDWQAASSAAASDGVLSLWIDGGKRAEIGGINNASRRIEQVRVGVVDGIDPTTLGINYFDAFESRRSTYIGPEPSPTPSATATLTPSTVIPPTATLTATPPQTTPTPTAVAALLESFESEPQNWQVARDVSLAGGLIERSDQQAADGSYAARLSTALSGSSAQLRVNFSDPATSHQWNERPGTWHWQQASVFLPAATVTQLGPGEYLTLAGFWPSAGGSYGWFLRVGQDGRLTVQGYTTDGVSEVFNVYGRFPTDRWVELELGLHSQHGPGVKRAFAFLLDGDFYGWYRQGHMTSETYDRVALGIVATNSNDPLVVFVDQWRVLGRTPLPGGPDARSRAALQEQDFRSGSGVQVQYDWSTWAEEPVLHQQYGLYSAVNRLQAGRNLDRMPELADGWAEIELDWPQGRPPSAPSSYFGPMVGFHKEVNREENLEVIPIGQGNGRVDLALEAWTGGSPVILARWPLPAASIGGGSHIPEPGDIIRVRWERRGTTALQIRASYYDASAARWHPDVISGDYEVANINGINYLDGHHNAASVTIDSPFYAIRRFKLGTLETAP